MCSSKEVINKVASLQFLALALNDELLGNALYLSLSGIRHKDIKCSALEQFVSFLNVDEKNTSIHCYNQKQKLFFGVFLYFADVFFNKEMIK